MFLSRWLAFFCNCCSTRSRVVRYSSANSDTTRQNSLGLVSGSRASGTPSHSRKRWKRFMTRRWTTLSTMMRSAQSAKKSDILEGRETVSVTG